jgi:Rrf2 family protein
LSPISRSPRKKSPRPRTRELAGVILRSTFPDHYNGEGKGTASSLLTRPLLGFDVITISSIVFPMQLSMRTDYALRALFTLVEHYGGQPIPIIELARRNDIPKRFLEHIMLDLKERGWVDSVAGKRGGYRLARSPERITMGEVVRHFDGYLAPIACVSVSDYKRCSQEPVCRFRRVMLQSRNMVAQLMDKATLAEVMHGKPVSDAEVAAIQGIYGEGI